MAGKVTVDKDGDSERNKHRQKGHLICRNSNSVQ